MMRIPSMEDIIMTMTTTIITTITITMIITTITVRNHPAGRIGKEATTIATTQSTRRRILKSINKRWRRARRT